MNNIMKELERCKYKAFGKIKTKKSEATKTRCQELVSKQIEKNFPLRVTGYCRF